MNSVWYFQEQLSFHTSTVYLTKQDWPQVLYICEHLIGTIHQNYHFLSTKICMVPFFFLSWSCPFITSSAALWNYQAVESFAVPDAAQDRATLYPFPNSSIWFLHWKEIAQQIGACLLGLSGAVVQIDRQKKRINSSSTSAMLLLLLHVALIWRTLGN
jgi:hypothetical protein